MTERQIYVTKNQEIQGPYTPREIQARLMSGQFLSTDLAWHQGVSDWKILSDLVPSAAIHSRRTGVVQRKFSGFARTSYFIGLLGVFLWLAVFMPSTSMSRSEGVDQSSLQQVFRVFMYVYMGTNALGIIFAILALMNRYSSKTKAIYGLLFNSILLVMFWAVLKY